MDLSVFKKMIVIISVVRNIWSNIKKLSLTFKKQTIRSPISAQVKEISLEKVRNEYY